MGIFLMFKHVSKINKELSYMFIVDEQATLTLKVDSFQLSSFIK